MTDNRNTILAVILSGLVLIGWQYFFNIPQMEKQRALQQTQAELAKPALGDDDETCRGNERHEQQRDGVERQRSDDGGAAIRHTAALGEAGDAFLGVERSDGVGRCSLPVVVTEDQEVD